MTQVSIIKPCYFIDRERAWKSEINMSKNFRHHNNNNKKKQQQFLSKCQQVCGGLAHDFWVSQFDNIAQNQNADVNVSQIFMREIKARNDIYALASKLETLPEV